MTGAVVERFVEQPWRDGRSRRADRSRAALLSACRRLMVAGCFRPTMAACCIAADRGIRTGFEAYDGVDSLYLAAIDHVPTRAAIAERILGDDRAALPDEALCRLARAVVTGRG